MRLSTVFGGGLVFVAVFVIPACTTSSRAATTPAGVPTTAEARPAVGGPCEYVAISGVATIVSVGEVDPQHYSCPNNPVQVLFDFVPDDAGATEAYRWPDWPDTGQRLTIAAGANPPRRWVTEEGLTAGSQHRCLRREVVSGACPPVLFEFPDLDQESGRAACWRQRR